MTAKQLGTYVGLAVGICALAGTAGAVVQRFVSPAFAPSSVVPRVEQLEIWRGGVDEWRTEERQWRQDADRKMDRMLELLEGRR